MTHVTPECDAATDVFTIAAIATILGVTASAMTMCRPTIGTILFAWRLEPFENLHEGNYARRLLASVRVPSLARVSSTRVTTPNRPLLPTARDCRRQGFAFAVATVPRQRTWARPESSNSAALCSLCSLPG